MARSNFIVPVPDSFVTESHEGLSALSNKLGNETRQAIRYLQDRFDPQFGAVSYIASAGDFSKRVVSPPEIFSSLIIGQSLVDGGLFPSFLKSIPNLIIKAANTDGFVHFFYDKSLLVADLDCTAVAYSLLIAMGQSPSSFTAVIDQILNNVNEDGIIEVYAKPAGEHAGRIDPCVLANILHLLYTMGRASEAGPSEQFVYDTLKDQSYLNGTRYYPSPDAFLYFLSRVIRDFPAPRHHFLGMLLSELWDRREQRGTFIDLALRYSAMDNLGIGDPNLRQLVLNHRGQQDYWPAESFFKYGRTSLFFGGEPLSTGLGIRACVPKTVSKFAPSGKTPNI